MEHNAHLNLIGNELRQFGFFILFSGAPAVFRVVLQCSESGEKISTGFSLSILEIMLIVLSFLVNLFPELLF
jgi:hypothetical protein